MCWLQTMRRKKLDHTGHYKTAHWMDTLRLFEQRQEKTCYFAYSKKQVTDQLKGNHAAD